MTKKIAEWFNNNDKFIHITAPTELAAIVIKEIKM